MPFIDNMVTSYSELPENLQVKGLGLASSTNTQNKINNLNTKVQDKINNLNQTRGQIIAQNIDAMDKSGYELRMLQEIPDGDSPLLVGDTEGRRLGGDPTIPKDPAGWVDAPEVYHGKFSETPKEQARIERQRQQYGLSSTDEVFTDGEKVRLETLYNLIGRPIGPDGKEWTPGPIEKGSHIWLGDKNNPLNIPVMVNERGDFANGRPVSYLMDENGKINQSSQLARAGYLSQPTTNNKVSTGSSTYAKAMADKVAEENENTYVGNLVDATQAGLGTFAARTADTAVDALIRGAKSVTTNEAVNKFIEGEYVKNGDFIGADKYKETKEYGFDDKNIVDAQNKISKALETKSFMDTVKAVGAIAKAGPEVLLTSSGDMAAAFAGPAGWLVWAGNFNNEILEERAKEVGGVDNLQANDRLIAGATAIPAAMLNQFTKGNVGLTEVTGAIKEAVGKGGLEVAKQLGKKIAIGAVGEAAEEATQEALVEIGKKLETANQKDIGSDKFWEQVITAGALAAGAGGTMSTLAGGKELLESTKSNVSLENPPKDTPKGKPEVSDEGYTGLTEDEKINLRESIDNFVTNTESTIVPLHEKISTIRDMEEKVLRLDDREPNKEKLNALIKHTKDEIVRGLESADDIDEFTRVLGSKQGFLDLLEDVVETTNNNFSEPLRINLEKIAGSFGINSEDFSRIRKDMGEVEIEATKSARGYLTQGKALRSILGAVEPDTAKAEELLKRMQGFEASQHKWVDKYDAAVKDFQKQIAEYNADVKKGLGNIASEPAKYPFTISKNSKFELNAIKLDDGTYVFNNASDKIRDRKVQNITGIKQELEKSKELLQKAKVDPSKTGVQYSPIIDPDSVSDNAIKKAVTKTKRMFDAFKVSGIITSEITSTRNKAIVNGNEQIVNRKEYNKDDTVAVMLPVVRTQADFDKARKEIVRQDSQLKKLIKAAQEAGATIILDPALRETKTKKLPKFKVTSTVDGKKVTKEMSIRDVLAEQLTRYSGKGLEYKSHMGTSPNVFKPASVVEEESKSRKQNKLEKDKLELIKEGIRNNAYNKFLAGKEIVMTEGLIETFKTKDRLDNYLNNRKEKEIEEYKKNVKEYNRLERKVNSVLEEAETAQDIITSNRMIEAADDLIGKMNKLSDRLKELSGVKEFAQEEIEVEEEIAENSKNILAEYKELKELLSSGDFTEEEAKQELKELEDRMPQNVVSNILDNSYSKGAEPIVIESKTSKQNKTTGETEVTTSSKKYFLDINDIVEKKKITSLDMVEVNDMFDNLQTKDYFSPLSSKEYIEEARRVLDEKITKVSKRSKNFTVDQLTMKNSPAYSLLFNKDGGINDTTVMAVKLALDEYITYKSKNLSPFYKTKGEVAQMNGVLEHQVSHEQYELLKDKGVFQKTFNDEVGKAIMSKLGFGKKNGVEDEVYNRLVAEMGQLARIVGVELDILVEDEVLAADYAEVATKKKKSGSPEKSISKDIKIGFVKLNVNENGELPTEILNVIRDDYKAVHDIISDESVFRKEPKFLPIGKKNRRYVREQVAKDIAGAKIPKGINEFVGAEKAIDNLIDIEWKINDELLDGVSNMDQDVLKKWMGYKSKEDMESMSFEAREAAVSSNRDIESNLQELLNLREDAHRTLWFDWFYTSNGRYMMDSNTVNPQTEKQLHRWLITPSSHKIEYNRTNTGSFIDSKGKKLDAEVKYAIAQSMGFAVDKKSTNKINELADKLLEMSAEELAEIKHTVLVEGKHYEKNGVKIEPEHIGHFLQGMDFLEKALTGNKFSSSLSAEFDAVTSGLGIKMLQMPILRSLDKDKLRAPNGTVWYWLNKVGVFKPEQLNGINSMNDVLDSVGFYGDDKKFYDSYQSLAVDTKIDSRDIKANAEKSIYKNVQLGNIKEVYDSIEKVLPKLDEDGSVSSALRTLFKDPFMTFNYSAGLRSIRGSLARNMVGKLLNEVAKANSDYKEVAEFLAKQVRVDGAKIDVNQLVEMLRTEKASSIMIGDVSLEDVLLKTVDSSYGAKVEEIMKNNFGEFMAAHENINSAFKVMFSVFNNKYKKAISEVPSGELTNKKKLEIIEDLRKYFPVIKGPLSVELNEGVHVYATKTAEPKDESVRQDPAQTYITDSEYESVKANYMIKMFEEAMNAGSVIPVHYIDAAMMAQLTKGKDITAIHDAIIPPLNKAKDRIKEYNKAMVEIGRSYSMIEAMNDMLNRVELTPEEIKELNATKINVKMEDGEYKDIGLGNNFNRVKKEFGKTAKLVREGREKLFEEFDNDGVVIGHMAGMPDTMWSNEVTLKEEHKGNIDIITPSEVFEKNINKIIECKE